MIRLVFALLAIGLAVAIVIPVRLQWELFNQTKLLAFYSLAAIAFARVVNSWRDSIWDISAGVTFRIVDAMLRPFLPDLISDPNGRILGTHRFLVKIADTCGGVEGAGLMLAFSLMYLIVFRKEHRFPQSLWLVVAGVVVLFAANSLRIAALILLGHAGASQLALAGFHSEAGWVAFLAVALGFCVALRRFSTAAKSAVGKNPASLFLCPLMASVLCGMLVNALTGDVQWTYFIAAPLSLALIYHRSKEHVVDWRFGWLGIAAGAAVFIMWIAFDLWMGPAPDTVPPILQSSSTVLSVAWIAFRLLSGIVAAPLIEELAFRGFAARRLMGTNFETIPFGRISWTALLVSSALFAAVHGAFWGPAFVAGGIYCLVAVKSNRLGEAIGAHATTNAMLAVWVLVTRQWHLWQ